MTVVNLDNFLANKWTNFYLKNPRQELCQKLLLCFAPESISNALIKTTVDAYLNIQTDKNKPIRAVNIIYFRLWLLITELNDTDKASIVLYDKNSDNNENYNILSFVGIAQAASGTYGKRINKLFGNEKNNYKGFSLYHHSSASMRKRRSAASLPPEQPETPPNSSPIFLIPSSPEQSIIPPITPLVLLEPALLISHIPQAFFQPKVRPVPTLNFDFIALYLRRLHDMLDMELSNTANSNEGEIDLRQPQEKSYNKYRYNPY